MYECCGTEYIAGGKGLPTKATLASTAKIVNHTVMTISPAQAPRPRHIGAVNWIGLWTLTNKEIGRFLKVLCANDCCAGHYNHCCFYLVFAIAMRGGDSATVAGQTYLFFLAPGLIMMSMAQNAFANTSSSLVISKVQGNIVDVLMPPLSPLELTAGYMLGGIARGLIVGMVSIGALSFFVDIPVTNIWCITYYAITGSMMLALLGVVGGIWSQKFDHLAAVQNFIVMPATFLSGTFYTADKLPENWQFLCHLNPFFYMIDGFRYGFIGMQDDTLGVGALVMVVSNIILLILAYAMIRKGYKLKS